MLRTTRRNRDSTSRKTLKRQVYARQVYAQEGGAAWANYSNLRADVDRTDQKTINKDWEIAIAQAVSAGLLPDTLTHLTNDTADWPVQLATILDAHRYQNTLLELAIKIVTQKRLLGDKTLSSLALESIKLAELLKKIDIINSTTNTLAKHYAMDVFTFLNMKNLNPSPTHRIEYMFSSYTIRNEELFIEPNILTNVFVSGLANFFISLKLDESDMTTLKGNSTNPALYAKCIRFYGRYWRRYMDKLSHETTGHGIGGSFYLNQEFKAGTDLPRKKLSDGGDYNDYNEGWLGTFQKVIDEHTDPDQRTFYSELLHSIINAKDTFSTDTYANINERPDWIKLITNLFIKYKENKGWKYTNYLTAFIPTPTTPPTTPAPSSTTPAFTFPSGTQSGTQSGTLDLPIAGTEITPKILLSRMDPAFISFMLHFLTVLRQNEKLYHDSLPADKQTEFVAKFGPPIAKMNEA